MLQIKFCAVIAHIASGNPDTQLLNCESTFQDINHSKYRIIVQMSF